jgi:F0F1-type ATP synthase assembly protein I
MHVLRDGLGRTYQKVILAQTLLAALTIIVALLASGQAAAVSGVAGAIAVLTGSLVYAALARESKVSAVSAGRVLGRHLLAEAVKVLVVLTIVLAALASGWFVAGWLLAAMGVTLLGHWLALLIIR